MNSKIGVLVFPAGEINSIELHDALATCVNIRLVGASSVERHGEFIFENYIPNMPLISEENFVQELNKLILQEKIDIVIPTHDDVALFFAENKDKILAKVLTQDYETAIVCRDKRETYKMFEDLDFCPKTYQKIEGFPVFLKPRKGQGSVNAKRIDNIHDIDYGIDLSQYVICEYLPGEEITVDCFTDYEGKLRCVMPRTRERVMAGVSVRSTKQQLTKEIESIAHQINQRLHFIGLWYMQLKKNNDEKWKLLEISTRCAGTMCLTRATGLNLPLLSVYSILGNKVDVFANDFEVQVDRTLISRYKTNLEYECVYIDLDDTILIGGKVHLPAIWYLYQCKNKGIEVILLTRHSSDHVDSVKEVLHKNSISVNLFSGIIEIDFDVPKYKVIEKRNSIFIDNAFEERKMVHGKLGIPVFDVDGFEVLMDWRC